MIEHYRGINCSKIWMQIQKQEMNLHLNKFATDDGYKISSQV